jgi:hypothetical protein
MYVVWDSFRVYIEKVSHELGFTIGVIRDVDEYRSSISPVPATGVVEGLGGIKRGDVLLRLFSRSDPTRPGTSERVYISVGTSYKALSEGRRGDGGGP